MKRRNPVIVKTSSHVSQVKIMRILILRYYYFYPSEIHVPSSISRFVATTVLWSSMAASEALLSQLEFAHVVRSAAKEKWLKKELLTIFRNKVLLKVIIVLAGQDSNSF